MSDQHNGPVLDQINIVVRDMETMTAFYRRLGVEIAPTVPQWERHHRNASTPGGLDFDFDSAASAQLWNQGWTPDRTGVVIGFRLPTREAVDSTYDDLVGAGHVGEQPPYDAFFGARYAVVRDPDDNSVGLMSPIDPALRWAPPDPSAQ
jgi:catechol 2,3-dioxygenase-like lactoylglutathione lyase family enzyme